MSFVNMNVTKQMVEDNMHVTRKELETLVNDMAQRYVLAAIAQHENTNMNIEVDDYKFKIHDIVLKHTGDYKIYGTVVGRFEMLNGAKRYVVEHQSVPEGSFVHIYSAKNIMLSSDVPFESTKGKSL